MLGELEITTKEMISTLTNADKAKIIELCVAKGLCITLVANAMKISTQTVSRVIDNYIPEKNNGYKYLLTFKSKV